MLKRRVPIMTQPFLANLPMFSEMSREELDRIAGATLPVYAEKGEAIVHCGDECTGFHVVVYGQVKLGFTSAQGVEKVVEIVRPVDTPGAANQPHPAIQRRFLALGPGRRGHGEQDCTGEGTTGPAHGSSSMVKSCPLEAGSDASSLFSTRNGFPWRQGSRRPALAAGPQKR